MKNKLGARVYLGDFSYSHELETPKTMSGLWDSLSSSLSNTVDKLVDKGTSSIQNSIVKAGDNLLNDTIAKLLGTGSTVQSVNGGTVTLNPISVPGQTFVQTQTQPMDTMTKVAIGGAIGLSAIVVLTLVLRKK